jgi:hypothetical protein
MNENIRIISVPVVIIVFNRADLTKLLLDKLSQFRLSKLYVVMDGPRDGNVKDVDERVKIISMLDRIEFADCVERQIADDNMGIRDRIVSGLNWVFDKEESAIILEDDCLPSDTFLHFCELMLDKYKDDERVGVISGTNFIESSGEDNTYHFSKYCNVWGWASWRRVWNNLDVEMSLLSEENLQNLRGRFNYRYEHKYWRAVFNQTKSGDIQTWDYQFWLSVWLNGQTSIIPSVNQIDNLGWGHINATHTTTAHPAAHAKSRNMAFPLVEPPTMLPDAELDKKIFNLLYTFPPIVIRVKNKLIRMLLGN